MDTNELRAFFTVAALFLFLVIVAWVYAPSRRKDFVEAAQLPFQPDDVVKEK